MSGRDDIDALLFDLGNVVVRIDFDRVCARWAGLAGVPADLVRSRFHHGDAYQRHERGEIGIGDYCESLRADLGLDLDDDALVDGWQRVFVEAIEPTATMLRELRGRVPLHLFSNTNAAHYAFWRERYAAALEPFDRIFVSSELGARKPEREAFERVAAAIGAPPQRILFFDDTAANIEGARRLNMPSILVRSPEDVRAAVGPWLAVEKPRTRP